MANATPSTCGWTPSSRRRSLGPDSMTSVLRTSRCASSCGCRRWTKTRDRTGLGRLGFFNDCVRYASNRLRIRDLLQRHPEILEVRIDRPIVVVGLPRSGTTHLVNLMAADRAPPVDAAVGGLRAGARPARGDRTPVDDDPRWRRCQQAWEAMEMTLPHLSAMHPMHPDHVHEELELELPDFSSYTPEWVTRCPRVARLLPVTRPDPSLRLSPDGAADPPVDPTAAIAGCSSRRSTSSSWAHCSPPSPTPRWS